MTWRGVLLAVGALAAAGVGLWVGLGDEGPANAAGPFSPPAAIQGGAIAVELPGRLAPEAERGAALFAESCVACHGENAAGSENGPPLVHVIYEPGHHGDAAFYSAVMNGVRRHHWRYGNMPPVAGIGEAEIADIIAYVRTLQRTNGVN